MDFKNGLCTLCSTEIHWSDKTISGIPPDPLNPDEIEGEEAEIRIRTNHNQTLSD